MQKQSIFLSNADILAFFRRVDKNNSSRISYSEFKTYVLPNVSPLRYSSNSKLKNVDSTKPSYQPYDYLPYNPNKYSTRPLSSSAILEPTTLSSTYALERKSSPYKRTPYLASSSYSDSYDRPINKYNRTFSGSPALWTGLKGDFLASQNLPRPQVPQHTFYHSERSTELHKYGDFYPYSTGKYFDSHYYPLVRRHLHYPLKFTSTSDNNTLENTLPYNTANQFAYSTHHYYPTHFHPTLTAKRESESSFLPDPTGYQRSYDEHPKFDHKYVTMQDMHHYPKMVELKYRKSANDSFYSTLKDRTSVSPQKELNLAPKQYQLQPYAKVYGDDYKSYASTGNAWNSAKGNPASTSSTRYDLASTAATIRVDVLMDSTKNFKPNDTANKTGFSTGSKLYDVEDIKQKYQNVQDSGQGNYDFARKY